MRNTTTILFTILLFITLLCSSIYWTANSDHFQLFGDIISRVETKEKVVALTFDDGPSPVKTEQILDILEREDVKATFFLVGDALKKNEKEAALLINSRHEIGNHSYSHNRMVFTSYAQVEREIESTNKIIRGYGYTDRLHFRPPFGKKLLMLPLYLRNHGIKTITWDVEPETWGAKPASIEERIQRALNGTTPGSIILMHVMYGNDWSMQAVTPIIRGLKAQGYRFLTVSELINNRTKRHH